MTFVTEALQEAEFNGGDDFVPLTQSDQAVFERLWQIDDEHRAHAKFVADHITAMDTAIKGCDEAHICKLKPTLLGDLYSLKERLDVLGAVDTLGDAAHDAWKSTLRKSMEDLLGRLDTSRYTDISEALNISDPEMKFVDSCTYI